MIKVVVKEVVRTAVAFEVRVAALVAMVAKGLEAGAQAAVWQQWVAESPIKSVAMTTEPFQCQLRTGVTGRVVIVVDRMPLHNL